MGDVRIAVIGAGMAGLACAQELARADANVTVFERSRGLGGRLATRRQGDLAFDHGAQFITARSRPFVRYAELACAPVRWRLAAAASWKTTAPWDAPIEDWWIGTPGMSALVRPLARNIDIRRPASPCTKCIPSQRGWELLTDAGRQNVDLRRGRGRRARTAGGNVSSVAHGRAFRHLTDVRMAPCWAGLYHVRHATRLRRRRHAAGRRVPSSGRAANSEQAGTLRQPQCWVVHATLGLVARASRARFAAMPRSCCCRLSCDASERRLPRRRTRPRIAGVTRSSNSRSACLPRRRRDGRRRVRRLVHRAACRGGVRKRPQPRSLLAVDGRSRGRASCRR